jgi:hypothetical protein
MKQYISAKKPMFSENVYLYNHSKETIARRVREMANLGYLKKSKHLYDDKYIMREPTTNGKCAYYDHLRTIQKRLK